MVATVTVWELDVITIASKSKFNICIWVDFGGLDGSCLRVVDGQYKFTVISYHVIGYYPR